MNTVTIKLNEEMIATIESHYQGYELETKGDYLLYRAKKDDCIVDIYSSKKGYKAVFKGTNALEQAQLFDANAEIKVAKVSVSREWIDLDNQIGSDEVGVGDFFGPMIVVACYVKKEDIPFLKELGVDDSKKLKDEKILNIVPKLLKVIKHSKLHLNNEKYNDKTANGMNMNELKSKLHNQALYNVLKRSKNNLCNIYVDQFVSPSKYYSYLFDCKDVVTDIIFKTKGENYYPSVACASLIARYTFLKEMEVLNKRYDVVFPKGASLSVDEFAKKFVTRYGIEELKKVAKINFSNYQKLL